MGTISYTSSAFSCFLSAGWATAGVVLFDDQIQRIGFEVGAVHNEFVFVAILVADVCIRLKWTSRRFVEALHYAEGRLDNASSDRLVGLLRAFKE